MGKYILRTPVSIAASTIAAVGALIPRQQGARKNTPDVDGATGDVRPAPGLTIGDARDDRLIAGHEGQKLDGRTGDDTLVGQGGFDRFVVRTGEGSDTIKGFAGDRLILVGFGFASKAALIRATVQSGSDLVIDLGTGERLTLLDMTLAELGEANVMLRDSVAQIC